MMSHQGTQEPVLTKRALGWAGAAAFLACAACCALPLIAVVGSGLMGSLLALLSPGTELIAALIAGGATLAFFVVRARQRAKSCATTCTLDRSCCGSDSEHASAP